MTSRLRRSRSLALVLAAFTLAAFTALAGSGCGGDSGGSGGGAGEPVTIRLGVIPIAAVAPVFLGDQKGFFREENLTVETQFAQGGAAIIPSVVSGDFQIGFSNTTSLIIAGSEGLPIQVVSQGVLGGETPSEAWDAVLVSEDSPIRSAEDLEGKTIAVDTLNNVGPLTINTALAKRGVDYEEVEYIEVPFPDMNAALEAGRMDAVWVVEPFVTQGKAAGSRAILNPYEETAPNLTVATYFVSSSYLEENPDVVDRFVRAMERSLSYAQRHPDEVREVVLDYTEIPREAAQAMTLPQWQTDLNRPTIEMTAELAERYGFVEQQPDLSQLVPEE